MLNRVSKGLCLLLAALVAVPAMGAAVYKCRDEAGRLTVQDHPCGPEVATQFSSAEAGAGEASAGRHLLWRVTGPRGDAYLVGSIHFGTPDMYPLPAVMSQAFRTSQVLVVETNLTALDPVQMAQIVAAKAMYGNGRTLSQALSPETWEQLDKALQGFGVSAQLVEQQKPWFVSMTLTSLALRRFGFSEELGIDNHFMTLAKRSGKPILELETFQQQLDFLDGFSEFEQEEMLKETFQDLDKGKVFLADMLRAWQTGNARKIDVMMNDELRNGDKTEKRLYHVLIAQRNLAMADKLDALLKRGGSYFVVLGAAHFVGRDGLVELLQAKGYQVRQR